MAGSYHVADSGLLLSRVAHSVKRRERVTFLLGSALTAPGSAAGEVGVPGADAMIDEVKALFTDPEESDALNKLLQQSEVSKRYEEAMRFVMDCRGQDTLNELIRNSVLLARIRADESTTDPETVESDIHGWHLRLGVKALGQLVTEHPRAC